MDSLVPREERAPETGAPTRVLRHPPKGRTWRPRGGFSAQYIITAQSGELPSTINNSMHSFVRLLIVTQMSGNCPSNCNCNRITLYFV